MRVCGNGIVTSPLPCDYWFWVSNAFVVIILPVPGSVSYVVYYLICAYIYTQRVHYTLSYIRITMTLTFFIIMIVFKYMLNLDINVCSYRHSFVLKCIMWLSIWVTPRVHHTQFIADAILCNM